MTISPRMSRSATAVTCRQGIVTRTSPQRFAMRCESVASCALCAAGQGCQSGVLGRWLGRGDAQIELDQPDPPLAVGDPVVIAMPTNRILQAAATVYLWPLVGMLIGAVAGKGWDPAGSELPQITGAVVGLLTGVLLARSRARQLLRRPGTLPVVVR